MATQRCLINVHDLQDRIVIIKDCSLSFPYGEDLEKDSVLFFDNVAYKIYGEIVNHTNLCIFSIRPIQMINLENNAPIMAVANSRLTGLMRTHNILSSTTFNRDFGNKRA